MSKQAVLEFRKIINEDADLQRAILTAYDNGRSEPDWVALGKQHHLAFTKAEAEQVIAENEEDSELSDFELEMVAAANPVYCEGGPV